MMSKYERRVLDEARPLVVSALQNHGEQTQGQLLKRTRLGGRTLRKTLEELYVDGVVTSDFVSGPFPRKMVYLIRSPDIGVKRYKTSSAKTVTAGGLVCVQVLMPPYLYESIRKEAVDQRRSLSAQVVVNLEAGISVE